MFLFLLLLVIDITFIFGAAPPKCFKGDGKTKNQVKKFCTGSEEIQICELGELNDVNAAKDCPDGLTKGTNEYCTDSDGEAMWCYMCSVSSASEDDCDESEVDISAHNEYYNLLDDLDHYRNYYYDEVIVPDYKINRLINHNNKYRRHHNHRHNHRYHNHRHNGYFAAKSLTAYDYYDDDEFVNRPNLQAFGNDGQDGGPIAGAKNIFSVNPDAPPKMRVKWPRNGADITLAAVGGDSWTGRRPFTWNVWKRKWDRGLFAAGGRYHSIEAQVAFFRKKALDLLLHDTNGGNRVVPELFGGDNRQCFDDMGSNKPKSDLDFTNVRWDYPEHIVEWLGLFYRECKRLFGNYPMEVFDMTFYIATAIVSHKPGRAAAAANDRNCYNLVPAGNIRNELLTRMDGGADIAPNYEVYSIAEGKYSNRGHANGGINKDNRNQQANYIKIDEYMQFYLINKRLTSSHPGHPDHALDYLIKFSKIYYNEIARLNNGDDGIHNNCGGHISNDNLLYLHSLLCWMNYYSDESYITNIALLYIWFLQKSERNVVWGVRTAVPPPVGPVGTKPQWLASPSNPKKYLMVLDQMAFMREYMIESMTHSDSDPFVFFVDKISKYAERAGSFMCAPGSTCTLNEGSIHDDFWDNEKINAGGGTNKIDGIPGTSRKNFLELYKVMKVYADDVRGKPGCGLEELKAIMDTYKDDHSNWGAEAGWSAVRKGAKILFNIHKKRNKAKKVYKELIQPLQENLVEYFKKSIDKKNIEVIEHVMEFLKDGAEEKIVLRDHIFYNAAASQLDPDTNENTLAFNLYAAASTTQGSTFQWKW